MERLLVVIATAYIPLLGLDCLARLIQALRYHGKSCLRARILVLLAGLVIAYGLGLIDGILQLWPAAGLDYSTHTAVALVLGLFLFASRSKGRLLWLVSLPFYGALMIHLEYHSLADEVTTAVTVATFYFPFLYRLRESLEGDAGC